MPLPTNIDNLLMGQIVEHERIEFKETWDPQASLKTICAFANDIDNWGGGYVVIGAKEREGSPELTGIPAEKIDPWLKDILNKCKLIRPSYMPVCDVAERDGKLLIVLWCPGGSVRPYSSPKVISKDNRGRICYIRKMASTVEPSDVELRELYALADNVPFDDRPNHHAELADLNPALILSFLKEVGSDLYTQADSMDFEDLCRSMEIVDGPSEYCKPKNVGLLFFNSEPRRFFPCAQIDVVEFPDGLGGDRIFENTFTGPLDHQLRMALGYLRSSVLSELVIKHEGEAEAERIYNYPYAAVEEALSNAVYHKGYDVREPIEVRVLPDRMEILSYPGADRSVSREALRSYRAISRRYRNRRVGDFLKELRLTEGRNTGINKILRSLRLNGSPDPIFETDEDRLYFLVTLFMHPDFLPEGAGLSSSGPAEPTERERRIISYLAERPGTTMDMASAELGIPRATLARDIAHLREVGVVRYEGSNRNGRWVILQ